MRKTLKPKQRQMPSVKKKKLIRGRNGRCNMTTLSKISNINAKSRRSKKKEVTSTPSNVLRMRTTTSSVNTA